MSADPERYSEAFLGRPNGQYVSWILQPASWGGAIELAILASHFRRQIHAADVQTCRVDRYGEGGGYPERGLLL